MPIFHYEKDLYELIGLRISIQDFISLNLIYSVGKYVLRICTTAAAKQSVRAFALHAEGWVSNPGSYTEFVRTGSGSSTENFSATGVSIKDPYKPYKRNPYYSKYRSKLKICSPSLVQHYDVFTCVKNTRVIRKPLTNKMFVRHYTMYFVLMKQRELRAKTYTEQTFQVNFALSDLLFSSDHFSHSQVL